MIPEKIKGIMQKLLDNKFEAYIIGGAVRDYFLGVEPHDYDIFTNATGEQILKIFPKGVVIGNEERQEKILTVIVDDVEISQFRSNGERTKTGISLKEHQATCDFTINSMAMDKDGNIIDPHHGKIDLYNKILKFVGSPEARMKEDPLRILRGIRFCSKYNLKLFEHEKLIEKLNLLDTLPKERIREEFMKIIQYPESMKYLWSYFWCKEIIYKIFPELKDVVGMKGGDHHNEVVDRHMINCFKESCKITDDVRLRLACLLHDIGKGVTYTEANESEVILSEDGSPMLEQIKSQTHFYEHENKGADMMEKRLSELMFSKEDIKYITTLIRLHMYTYKTKPGKKSYIRFFNKLDDAKIPIEDYIMLIYCDHQGNMAKPRIKFGDFIKSNWLYKRYQEIKYSDEPMKVKDLKISGKDVMEKLGIKPGPKIGIILNEIFNKVMEGELENQRAMLLHYLRYLDLRSIIK